MSARAEAFDRWIRTGFVEMNTELENLYFAQDDRANGRRRAATRSRRRCATRVTRYVVELLAEGNTGEGFDSGFGVLGNVGLYLGALRRHELTNPAREERSPFAEASSLALHVGASLGMAPRFATAHLATHNLARRRRAQKLHLACRRVPVHRREHARHLEFLSAPPMRSTRIVPLGVSSPVADVLFEAAKQGLRDVIRFNERLFEKLDVERFFFSRAALLQALSRRPAGISRRQCRRFLRHQRDRPAAGALPRQRSVLRAAAGRQDAVHAACRPGAAAGLHDRTEPARRVAGRSPTSTPAAAKTGSRQNARAYLEVCDCSGSPRPAPRPLVSRVSSSRLRLLKMPEERWRVYTPPAGRRCPCCCARSSFCAICGWRRQGRTSDAAPGSGHSARPVARLAPAVSVTPYAVNHPVEAYGYRVEADGRRAGLHRRHRRLRQPHPAAARRRPGARRLGVRRRPRRRARHPPVGVAGGARPRCAPGECGRLVLTHIPAWNDPEVCRAQAAAVWPGEVELARPGAVYEL